MGGGYHSIRSIPLYNWYLSNRSRKYGRQTLVRRNLKSEHTKRRNDVNYFNRHANVSDKVY